MLKLGEIYERFYRDWNEAEHWYTQCTTLDAERADAWFYIGQHYRLAQIYEQAEPVRGERGREGEREKRGNLTIRYSLFQYVFFFLVVI